MTLELFRPLGYFRTALTSDKSPRQIAWGIALGTMVGILPKGNLTAWLFGIFLLATQVNLGSAMLSGFAVSAMAPWIDPLTHGIGAKLLASEMFRHGLGRLYAFPLIPWFALNNTVVVGSLLLGGALLFPLAHLSEMAIVTIVAQVARLRSTETRADASAIVLPASADRSALPTWRADLHAELPLSHTELELPVTVLEALQRVCGSAVTDAKRLEQ